MSRPNPMPVLGPFIEATIAEKGMSKAEFGRRIRTSRQNVSLILKKKSMDTELLWRISQVLETDFFHLLSIAFSQGKSQAPAAPTGSLEISLKLGDSKLIQLTADLVRRIIEDRDDDDEAIPPIPVPK